MGLLICKKLDDDWSKLPTEHVHFWLEGYKETGLRLITHDSWHVLFKHGKPKRLRKAK